MMLSPTIVPVGDSQSAVRRHKPIRLLTFSTLYPSGNRPTHGIFVETRLRHLLASGEVESRVIAPVPWFPSTNPRFGDYAKFAAVSDSEIRNGIRVSHPRYLLVPKVGMTSAPFTLARAAISAARKLIASGYDFDVIDAHYFYPDGVAAVMLGEALDKPVVITARGTDINLIPAYALPRRMIIGAAQRCAAIITVCAALKDQLASLGADPAKITVLRNGVDLNLFSPQERSAARGAFGVTRYCLLSVGHLVNLKGHHLAITALPGLPDVELLIAGAGPEEARLRRLATSLGVAERVRFLGSLSQAQLRTAYSAADALVLASSREGWPNVLLEAMACGTPVVASRVSGIPEVVATPEAGVLLRERTAEGIIDGVRRIRNSTSDRAATRHYAEGFSWHATTSGQINLFGRLLERRCSSDSDVRPPVIC